MEREALVPPMNDPHLTEMLRRCPPATHAAAQAFRQSRHARHVPPIVRGIVERYVEPELRPLVRDGDDGLRLVEDLGIDSLSLMEIAVLIEDVLEVTTTDEGLRRLRTISDVCDFAQRTVENKARGPGSMTVATSGV